MKLILCFLSLLWFQTIAAADLKNFWHSEHYGALSKGVLSRPAFVIDQR
ncbi:MAG: hypothetical protein ACOYMN_22725 [Roseimicrobium sp.]